jgi:hypothetical protein
MSRTEYEGVVKDSPKKVTPLGLPQRWETAGSNEIMVPTNQSKTSTIIFIGRGVRTSQPVHGSVGSSPPFHCGGPGSLTRQHMWDLWWIKWYWAKVFSYYLGFPLSVYSTNALYSKFIHLPSSLLLILSTD